MKTLAISFVLILLVACSETIIDEGRWRVTRLTTVIPESGARPEELLRSGRLVAEFVSMVRIYPEADCAIYIGREARPVWFAACGSRTPIPIVPYGHSDEWFTDQQGLARWTSLEISGNRTVVRKEVYLATTLATGRVSPTAVTSPVDGGTLNPGTREPAWLFAIRTNNCAALSAFQNIPLTELSPHDTPLIAAVLSRNRCATEVLMKRGADVDDVSSDGETALTTAVNGRDADLVKLLMASAPEPRTVQAAVERSKKLGQPEILEILQNPTQHGPP